MLKQEKKQSAISELRSILNDRPSLYNFMHAEKILRANMDIDVIEYATSIFKRWPKDIERRIYLDEMFKPEHAQLLSIYNTVETGFATHDLKSKIHKLNHTEQIKRLKISKLDRSFWNLKLSNFNHLDIEDIHLDGHLIGYLANKQPFEKTLSMSLMLHRDIFHDFTNKIKINKIQSINVKHWGISPYELMEFFSKLNIKSLEIRDTDSQKTEPLYPNDFLLKCIRLSIKGHIKDELISSFYSESSNIEHISISSDNQCNGHLEELLKNSSKIKTIRYFNNSKQKNGKSKRKLPNIIANDKITHLGLIKHNVSQRDYEILINRCKSIDALNVAGQDWSKVYDFTKTTSRLRALRLYAINLDDKSLSKILKNHNYPNIKELHICQNKVTDKSINSLLSSEIFHTIVCLTINESGVTDKGVTLFINELNKYKELPLSRLSLKGSLSDKSRKHLNHWCKNKGIQIS